MIGRLKFDLDDLANEMLDQLPIELFSSTSTTFLDPCMGGGQFVKAIEQRLRSYGHNKDNIAKRVYGVENSRLRINYAINKHGLVGQYRYCEDYLGYDEKMKFDVVIGNPPYQFDKKNNREKLWTRFVHKSFEQLIKRNGWLVFVTPTSWMSPSYDYANTSILNDYFRKNYVKMININECNKHFPGVGSQFSYYAVKLGQKTNNTQLVLVDGSTSVDLNNEIFDRGLPYTLDSTTLSISKKFFSQKNHFSFLKQYSGAVDLDNDGEVPVYHTAAMLNKSFSKTKSKYHSNRKVMISLSGKYMPIVDNGSLSPSRMVITYLLDARELTSSAKSVLNSPLYCFIIDKAYRYTGWVNMKILYSLPKVDLTRTWTDEELYEHFGLTQEEIDYIEATVK